MVLCCQKVVIFILFLQVPKLTSQQSVDYYAKYGSEELFFTKMHCILMRNLQKCFICLERAISWVGFVVAIFMNKSLGI